MITKIRNKIKGFSLVEIILTLGLYAIIVFSVSTFAIDSFRFTENRWLKVKAAAQIQEASNAILVNKKDAWFSMVENTNAGAKHIAYLNNIYEIIDGSTTQDGITISFTINEVMRDSNNNIVQSGGTVDFETRLVTINASWTDSFGLVSNYSISMYLNSWDTLNWIQTTQADFQTGTHSFTIPTASNGGAVELDLASQVQGNWCVPSLSITTYDLSRQGSPTAISAIPNFAFLATGENASGPAIERVNISSNNPPTITQVATYDTSIKVNDIFADGSYAYLTTDTNDKEVTIINVSTQPYAEVGSFDASGSTNGNAIWVSGNVGYMTQGNSFYTFNLTSKTGIRPQLGTVNLSGTGKDIKVVGNYAYVATDSNSHEMEIIDITNPSSLSIVGYADTNSAGATSLYVKADGTRVYLGTAVSATQSELFVINTSTKTGSRTIVTSIDTAGMSVRDVAVVEEDNRLIVVGSGGQEYQVYDISNEASIPKCGGLNNDFGIYGIATVVDSSSNAWAYILTGNSSQELMIVLGGSQYGGGGNGKGNQYISAGSYFSPVLDTNSTAAQYYTIKWKEQLFTNTDIKIQVRAGTSNNLNSETWVGPDGTSGTYFTNPNGEYLPDIIQNKRYLQFKVDFTSDVINTPIFEEIYINYQP